MAYRFSEKSWERIRSCDPRLQAIVTRAMGYQVMDITILEGYRSAERQTELLREGKTQVRWSKHNENPSRAIDIAPHPIDWRARDRFNVLAGLMLAASKELGFNLRWGGDWDQDGDTRDNNFDDLVHFELKE